MVATFAFAGSLLASGNWKVGCGAGISFANERGAFFGFDRFTGRRTEPLTKEQLVADGCRRVCVAL